MEKNYDFIKPYHHQMKDKLKKVSTYRKPNDNLYWTMVENAVDLIDQQHGSSKQAILNYISDLHQYLSSYEDNRVAAKKGEQEMSLDQIFDDNGSDMAVLKDDDESIRIADQELGLMMLTDFFPSGNLPDTMELVDEENHLSEKEPEKDESEKELFDTGMFSEHFQSENALMEGIQITNDEEISVAEDGVVKEREVTETKFQNEVLNQHLSEIEAVVVEEDTTRKQNDQENHMAKGEVVIDHEVTEKGFQHEVLNENLSNIEAVVVEEDTARKQNQRNEESDKLTKLREEQKNLYHRILDFCETMKRCVNENKSDVSADSGRLLFNLDDLNILNITLSDVQTKIDEVTILQKTDPQGGDIDVGNVNDKNLKTPVLKRRQQVKCIKEQRPKRMRQEHENTGSELSSKKQTSELRRLSTKLSMRRWGVEASLRMQKSEESYQKNTEAKNSGTRKRCWNTENDGLEPSLGNDDVEKKEKVKNRRRGRPAKAKKKKTCSYV